MTSMKHRSLQGQTDAMRLRQFLIDTHAIIGREFNWEPRRWEGSYWCVSDAERANPSWGANAEIWENAGGDIVGAAVPDGPGDLALLIHPHQRALEDAVLDWSEEHLATTNDEGERELTAWAFDWDTERQERLTRRGYAPRSGWFFQHRRRAIAEAVPSLSVPEGYVIRSVQKNDADVQRWVDCSNTVFGQSYGPEYHRNFQLYSPSHNYDLHLIAEIADGSFAAFVGLTVDTANRYAVFEPVGTHPDHRKRGLARALMYEGIRRLQELGTADTVYVANWGTSDAGKFYASVGMAHYATLSAWMKTF